MGNIEAKILVPCPLEGRDVLLHEKCLKCPDYEHFGIKGNHAIVMCKRAR